MRLLQIGSIVTALVAAFAPLSARAQRDRFFTTSDGVTLHYIEAGQGPTLVLIPGWTMPAWIFAPQIAAFSQRYHVVALDPRSQGDSDVASSGYNQDRRGQDIAELLDRLGPQPVALAGWSLGVLDSLAYVHTNGDSRLAGLVLIDNSVGEDPAPRPEPRAPLPRRRRPARPVTREVLMRNFVAGMFVRAQPPTYIDDLTEACLRTPPLAAALLLSYPVPRTYWKEAVYATDKPILYIVRPRLAGQAANLAAHDPYAEAVVLNDVGHAMFVDNPTEFNSILQSFLTRRVWR
ncbi:MAG TPA: alpha/beta hydrolase [Acetobacteraceae bacterium]|nr:alpha/beta hydrolase [Acetobacteraceae bacterium]